MIKTFEEFVNEGLLDIFSGDGCKNLETVCSAFAKRLSAIAPIKYKTKDLSGKIDEYTLDYSSYLILEYISADDNLVINRHGKCTIEEEAKRLAKSIHSIDHDEKSWVKHLTRHLRKSSDEWKTGDENKTVAVFNFTIPYLIPIEDKDEKDLYKLEFYHYTTSAIRSLKVIKDKNDKEIATDLLNSAFYQLYKAITEDPKHDTIIEYNTAGSSVKDIRKYIPSELINVVKKATKRKDLK
jgi:hypothetical protein